jgi:3,4-dihydroxy 2-butanone 4-phosphate synthase / GTP cyclohydrolase II
MKILESTTLPTRFGEFEMIAIESPFVDFPHIVLKTKGLERVNSVLTRIHSECMTGDVFGSNRCDCGEQLEKSLELLGKEKGILIYLRQEGRGIGLVNKMKAYNLQNKGLDTFEANLKLGFHQDERNFDIAIEILNHFGIKSIELITNNPEKIQLFEDSNIELTGRRKLEISPNTENKDYLNAKIKVAGHLF